MMSNINYIDVPFTLRFLFLAVCGLLPTAMFDTLLFCQSGGPAA